MAYDIDKHYGRIALRSDLTVYLSHLTRARPQYKEGKGWDSLDPQPIPGTVEASALDVLMEILESQVIKGSTNKGFIVGKKPAACFQDTPLYCLGQMFHQEKLVKAQGGGNDPNKSKEAAEEGDAAKRADFRYTLHGLSFHKEIVWKAGGRPVIYEQTDRAVKMLPEEEHWRIVKLDWDRPGEWLVDWTHEREWRVPGDFKFDLKQANVILPGKIGYDAFMAHKKQKEHDFASKVHLIVPVSPSFF